MSEITKELFYSIINSGDKTTSVNKHELYIDVVYFKHGVKLVYRTQTTGDNYYIIDINK